MERNSVSKIFNETPGSWGLRGDPCFWDDLKRHFENTLFPYSLDAFEAEVKRFFKDIAGKTLSGDSVYVEKYARGGMSNGMVSCSFWLEQGIPLLLERLCKANEESVYVFEYENKTRTAGVAMILTGFVFLITGVISLLLIPLYILFISSLTAIIFLPFLFFGTRQLILYSSSVQVHNGCIEYRRGGKTQLIPFSEVYGASAFSCALRLYTDRGTVRIEKNIQEYQRLYDLLSMYIPILNEAPESPVVMSESALDAFILPGVMTAAFFGAIIFMYSLYTSGSIELFPLIFMGATDAFFTVYFTRAMLATPYKYVLSAEGVSECSLIKSKLYPKSEILSVQYGQIREKRHTKLKMFRMVNFIKFRLKDGSSVTIDDRFTSYPIELAVRYAKKEYGVNTDAVMI